MKNRKGFDHWRTNVSCTEDAIENLHNGDTVTKFVSTDEGGPEGDYGVEIHGFVTGAGNLIITSEVLYRRAKATAEDTNG